MYATTSVPSGHNKFISYNLTSISQIFIRQIARLKSKYPGTARPAVQNTTIGARVLAKWLFKVPAAD
jgi:hypothetical protein